MKPLNSLVEMPPRMSTGLGELDLVLGGGIVHGSATLIGGEPGIGKSTLLIQTVAALARAGRRVAYISGEESDGQVRLRRSEEHTSELQSLMRISYAVFCLKKKRKKNE